MRALETKKLLTIIAPVELQRLIVETLNGRGIGGYTVVPATGAGTTGLRLGMLVSDSNVVIYVIMSEARLARVLEDIDAMMRGGYRLKALVQDIQILPRKGAGSEPR
jgi:PII-like signaling protein